MPEEMTAFCSTCPAAQDVTHTLVALGFRLTFQMKAETKLKSQSLAPLPAQFHYANDAGTEVVYLAGEDVPSLGDDDELDLSTLCYPKHASRFWLYPGASPLAVQRTLHTLAAHYHLPWLDHVPVQTWAA